MVLDKINLWIDIAASDLNYQMVTILESDIPVEALLDLDSDTEDVGNMATLSVITLARVAGVTAKWMTQRKGWTSESVSRVLYLIHRDAYLLMRTI